MIHMSIKLADDPVAINVTAKTQEQAETFTANTFANFPDAEITSGDVTYVWSQALGRAVQR